MHPDSVTEGTDQEMKENSRSSKAGLAMADALIEWIHLMYQKDTARRILTALIKRLSVRIKEFER